MVDATPLFNLTRLHLRITSEAFDDEIAGLIDACIDDMKVRGVDADSLLPYGAEIGEMNPSAVRAVQLYCKAQFGVANHIDETNQYWTRYDMLTQALSHASETRITPSYAEV